MPKNKLNNRRCRKLGSLDIHEAIWGRAWDIFWCKLQTQNAWISDTDAVAVLSYAEAVTSIGI
jgi:hypothetical protein